MMKKTNFLLVSLIAMMSVGVARAESTTKEYVDSQDNVLAARIKLQNEYMGMVRDWVNPKDTNGNRTTLQTTAQHAYGAINELNTALGTKADSADIPDVSDMETKTHAAATYQPKGDYLTEHQSLDAYATTEAMNAALADKADSADIPDVSGFVTTSALETTLGDYATTSDLNGKQAALTDAQLAAVNSGVTSTVVDQVNANKDAIALQGTALNSKADATATAQALNSKADAELTAAAINAKQDLIDNDHKLSASLVNGLAPVATTGSYNDLLDQPTIPAAQVNADWNATEGKAQILNKPSVYTQSETDTLLNAKANASDVYTKTETYSKSEVDTALDAVSGDVGSIGTQISTALSDYTTTTIEPNYALKSELPTIDTALSDTSTNPVQNKVVNAALGGKIDKLTIPDDGEYVLGFVDGVQQYIKVVDANGN